MTNTEIQNASKIFIGTTEIKKLYIGNTLIYQNNGSNIILPYDAEIEYLLGDGHQFINTNIVPNSSTGIKVKTAPDVTNYLNQTDMYIVGIRDNTSNTRWALGKHNESTLQFKVYYAYGTSTYFDSSQMYYLQGLDVTLSLNFLNDGKAINGTRDLITLSSLPFTPVNGIRIFGSSGVDDTYTKYAGKIYFVQISLGSDIVMDLIPVRVGSVGYLYDKISGQLFGNSGSGSFTLGPDTNVINNNSRLPNGYTELEYISSTASGSQYIDLNIKLYETLNTDYDIAIKFNLKGDGSDNTALATMFNNQNTTNPWPGVFIRKNNSIAQGRYVGGTGKNNTLGNLGSIIELAEKTSPNKNVTNLNNSGQTHSYGTSLFCAYSDVNNTPYRLAEADLYYFKLWVEGTLTRDMVPCINPNNVVGLYDLVNNVFYSSPNGAAFVAGPTV